jgi:hypothetical protein
MTKIFAHIAGLNDEGKRMVHDSFPRKDFAILDLDEVTSKIVADKNMNYMFGRYEYYKDKLGDGNLTRIEVKKMTDRVKSLERDMNLHWKKKMDAHILDAIDSTNKALILIGYSTYFKNHRIGINIKSSYKFFQKVNLIEHAKAIVAHNLSEHHDDIVEGTFPLDYLNHQFIIKKRDGLAVQYQKMGYQLDTINNIVNSLYIATNNTLPSPMFYASKEEFMKKLPLTNGRIVAYEDEWIAMVSALGDKGITKGFTSNGRPFVRGSVGALSQPVYLYLIADTTGFAPVPSKTRIYKYQNAKQPVFRQKVSVYDVLTKLREMRVKVELHNTSA